MTRLVFMATIQRVEPIYRRKYLYGIGQEAKYQDVRVGYRMTFHDNMSLVFEEQPPLTFIAGKTIKFTLEEFSDADPSPAPVE